MFRSLPAFLLSLIALPVLADDAGPYAGLETRAIKGLSAEDIAELEAGGGWGLALPAELSGWPGPAHVLELADQLDLTAAQRRQIAQMTAEMRAEAIEAGARFIAAEAALSDGFADPTITPLELQSLVDEAAAARGALRYVHLSRHLAIRPILTDEQVLRYNVLRGYTDDPCAAVPDGHDPQMWRRHNGCDG